MQDKLAELRETLVELQRELREVDQLDADTKSRLEGVMESINDALHREDTEALTHPSLRETINEKNSQLEDSSYPSLTRILNNLADILGNSGLQANFVWVSSLNAELATGWECAKIL